MKGPKGIFCLEGEWWGDLKRPSSVEPLLALLDQDLTYRRPHIHRDVGTVEELQHYLRKWSQRGFDDYPILYLAFHGGRGLIHVGDGRRATSEVTLEILSQELAGKCERRLIFFSSCETLDIYKWGTNKFLNTTGALAVCGYREQVDWIQSSAFELLVLAELQRVHLTAKGMLRARDRIEIASAGLHKALGFRMEVHPGLAVAAGAPA